MVVTRLIITSLIVALLLLLTRYVLKRRRRKNTIAFFHLYCSSGGGGERVLWHTIKALLDNYPEYSIYIYSHQNVREDIAEILMKVRTLFKIDLLTEPHVVDKIEFIPLRLSSLIEARNYPFLTILFQNLGSILLACEAAYRLMPEIYFETIGFAFTLPIFKFHGCTVITYTHYPTISNDMIQNVKTSKHASFNNRAIFVRSPLMRGVKLAYYKIIASLYGLAGRQADIVMVNSSWTQAHIDNLWNTKTHVVHPPCDVESFKEIGFNKKLKERDSINIVSIAQFRPEKNHQLQIEAFDSFLSQTGALKSRLTLYGGCRDESDKDRVNQLKEFINRLDLGSNVEIIVGASFECLLDGLRDADVAIHTMKNEHFGIVLLECMAAGLITVAHDSGGPKADIIDDGVDGFLATCVTEYTKNLVAISKMRPEERQRIRGNAMKKSDQFSAQVFEEKLIKLVDPYFRRNKGQS